MVNTGGGESREAEVTLRQALTEAFPQAPVRVESRQPPMDAFGMRGSVIELAEFAITIGLHLSLVWEIHKYAQANATTLANVKALVKALTQAGLDVGDVKIDVDGSFKPLPELLRRIGVSSDGGSEPATNR